ncbi:MAG TPA: hypothetical protein VFM18_14660, partial [Methanosarcina sp.]|nr:hypothetical protein [Methanosarcina sp.]
MNFEPQCKTKADVHREWARVLDMIDGTNVEQCHCFKYSNPHHIGPHYFLIGNPECYEFSIAIVEGKPVFRGDKLYKIDGGSIIADASDGHNLYGSGCCYAYGFLTWNPPK